MMTAERRRARSKNGRSLVKVGIGGADEMKLRAKIRGNDGDGLPAGIDERGNIIHGDAKPLPLVYDDGTKRTFLPSEAWVDAHFRETDDRSPDGKLIVVKFFDPRERSPITGAAPGMVRCIRCGRLTPPQAMHGRRCIDDGSRRSHAGWGPSPSAVAILAVRARHLKAESIELPSENTSDLRREIKHFEESGKSPKKPRQCTPLPPV